MTRDDDVYRRDYPYAISPLFFLLMVYAVYDWTVLSEVYVVYRRNCSYAINLIFVNGDRMLTYTSVTCL